MSRIMIIDDDDQVREMVRRLLEYAGYEVMEAADGDVGMAMLEKESADLVITDILMPNKEGLETIMGLRRSRPNLPIIAISGGGWSGSHGYLSTADKLGATRTLSKPFTSQEMIDTVAEVLAAAQSES